MSELIPMEACPLCGCRDHSPQPSPLGNLYSEKLALLSGKEEQQILRDSANVQCRECKLIYKQQWFPAALLERLFRECVPAHPKGWDALSGRFSPANVQHEVEAYSRALASEDQPQINRYRRSLSSILAAIPELDSRSELDTLFHAVHSGDTQTLTALQPLLVDVMDQPRPYSRFCGFAAPELWTYINTRLGDIASYAEVGCPLWGLLTTAHKEGRRATYLTRPEPNYWSDGCRVESRHCSELLATTHGIDSAPWSDPPATAYDAIGAFQYLDHLIQPYAFVQEVFARARAAIFILDSVDQPVAIQHCTGWGETTMQWLADQLHCRLDSGFESIRPSGNRLYLLSRTETL